MGVLVAGGLTGLLNQSSAQIVDGSLKFNKESEDRLTRTMVAGNQTKFTISCWLKVTDQADYLYLMGVSSECSVYITNTRKLHADFYSPDGSTWAVLSDTQAVFRDPSAWYHVVAMLDSSVGTTNADRYKIYVNGVQQTIVFTTYGTNLISGNAKHVNENGQTFQINSRPGGSYYNSFYLSQYNYIDGLALGPGYFGFTDPLTRTWRPKKFRAKGTTVNDGTVWSSGTVTGTAANASGSGGWTQAFDGNTSNLVYPTDSNGSTKIVLPKPIRFFSNVRLYAGQNGTSGTDILVNGINLSNSLSFPVGGGWLSIDHLITSPITSLELKNVGGQASNIRALEIDGVIVTDSTTQNLAFGANGFYLPIDGNSSIGEDKSGNGNNYTAVNFSGTSIDPDVLKDSPSGAVSGGRAQTGITTISSAPSNYPTWNPLAKGNINLSDGNLTAIPASNDQSCFATLSIPDNGKVYFEFTCIQRGGGGAQSPIWGVGNPSGVTLALNPQNSDNNASTWLYGGDGNKTGGGSGSTSYGTAFVAGDIIGVCVDRSNSRIWFSKNNVWQNSGNPNNQTDSNAAFTNVTSTGTLIPFFGNNNSTAGYGSVNFGQKPFKYAPPQGYLPLNSASATPETVITRPEQYVGLATYTGNGGTQSINVGLKPDLVWIKRRNVATSHMLYDQIRGSGTTAELIPNATYAQGSAADVDAAQYGYLSGYTSNGFTVQAGSTNGVYTNENSSTYVAWTWRAGGSKNTFNKDDVGYASAAAAGLTAGANANLVTGSSVGTKQGFSIIKFNASAQSSAAVQLPHGLSQSPSFLIVKALDSNGTAWYTWHKDLSNTAQNRLFLNGDNAQDGNTSIWNNTAPSSTTFSVGGDPHNNDNCIAYLWHDVPGLQKFGKYDGNNDANGPFIELGFRPTLFVMKQLTGTGYWMVYDSARDPINNGSPYYLFWNTNAAHGTGYDLDFLSNGVKLRTDNANFNASTPYVYMAWAEAPTTNLFGAQSNAR